MLFKVTVLCQGEQKDSMVARDGSHPTDSPLGLFIFGILSSLINHFIGFLCTSWCSHMLALLLVIIEIHTVFRLPLTDAFHTGYSAGHCKHVR